MTHSHISAIRCDAEEMALWLVHPEVTSSNIELRALIQKWVARRREELPADDFREWYYYFGAVFQKRRPLSP